MKQFLFLDIEGTLIEDFSNPVFLSEHKRVIQNCISEKITDGIQCFSWAICNEDEWIAVKPIIEEIEKFFGFHFSNFVFRDQLFPVFKRKFGAGLTFSEFEELCNSLGKETVFQIFIREQFTDSLTFPRPASFLLVDDRVSDTTLIVNSHVITTLQVKR